MSQRILVWDVPTRVFHWLLVVAFAGAFLTSEWKRFEDTHIVLGYTLLGLMAFRLLWGFIGTRYARFSSFLFKPGEIASYALDMFDGKPAKHTGHNPVGSLAIFALIALGIISGVTGVMLLQDAGGEVMEELHEVVSYGMLLVVALHVGGVIMSSMLHRENLAKSMVTGYKSAESDAGISRAHTWLGVIMIVAVVAFWIGYPATGLVPAGDNNSHTEQHDGDNDDDD
jgi:cytochrome b